MEKPRPFYNPSLTETLKEGQVKSLTKRYVIKSFTKKINENYIVVLGIK